MTPSCKGCVLVVDDEESIRVLLQQGIVMAGYECLIAGRAEEALDLLTKNQVDVVITDIIMPGMDGIELLRRIRQQYPADVIVMTGFAEDLRYENVVSQGARDFIPKPVSLKELVVRLERVLRERAVLAGRTKAEQEARDTVRRLTKVLSQVVNALASAMEKRDPYTSGHQQRVTQLACCTAKEMGLGEAQLEGIRIAGLLHDIGKISVPTDILSKPSRLSENEFSLLKEHPQVGFDILNGIEFAHPVASAVLQHHEREDGSGYPLGLAGGEIIVEAKILAVADVVEAMASHRPYRPALGIEAALAEISRGAGSVYSPEVVKACLKVFRENGFAFG